MKKVLPILTLLLALGCGGEDESSGPVATKGTEVPTQTTTQTVPIPASAEASPSPASQAASP